MEKTKKVIQHAPMDQFETVNGELMLEGKSIRQISKIAGQTPFYAYSKSVIKRNVDKLRKNFPKVSLHYAIKSNPMPQLVSFLSKLVDGLDVASGKELHKALATDTKPCDISFAGPAKTVEELTMAIVSGININVESATELNRIISISKELNQTPNIALRINPNFELKSSGMKMGGGSQQFGIDVEQLDTIFETIDSEKIGSEKLKVKGLHIFTGSQNLNPQSLIAAHDNIFELTYQLIAKYNLELDHLNIGGGFGIPYFPGDKHLELKSISENLTKHLNDFSQTNKNCEVILELGRYLVGNAGLYVCEVTDIKHSRGKDYLITNGGLHHHLAASGNFGQIIRKNYPVAMANKMANDNLKTYQFVGPLCTPLDILGNKVDLPEAEIGDLLVVYQSGAYGYTASPQDFLSHPNSLEILL